MASAAIGAALSRVVDEKLAVLCELRMKCQAEQSALRARYDLVREIQEYSGGVRVRLHHQDPAALFEHEQPSGPVMRIGDECRCGQPLCNGLKLDSRRLRRCSDR